MSPPQMMDSPSQQQVKMEPQVRNIGVVTDVEVRPKIKARKPRNTSHRIVRTIVKEIDGTYHAKSLSVEIPIRRKQRAVNAAKHRGISTRNIYAWSKSTSDENLIKYRDASKWYKNLVMSFQDRKSKTSTKENAGTKDVNVGPLFIKHPSLSDRKQKAHDIAHIHYDRIITLARKNTANILQSPTRYRGMYTPKNPSAIVLLDMTTDANLKEVLSFLLQDVETVDGDTYATLVIPLAKAGSAITVPVIIIKFKSYLDSPHTAWKSVKGTKKSTMRLYHDREGIHTGVLQDLDVKVERSDHEFKTKLIVVHDADINMSPLMDVVHTTADGLVDLTVSRLREMGLHYVD